MHDNLTVSYKRIPCGYKSISTICTKHNQATSSTVKYSVLERLMKLSNDTHCLKSHSYENWKIHVTLGMAEFGQTNRSVQK